MEELPLANPLLRDKTSQVLEMYVTDLIFKTKLNDVWDYNKSVKINRHPFHHLFLLRSLPGSEQ